MEIGVFTDDYRYLKRNAHLHFETEEITSFEISGDRKLRWYKVTQVKGPGRVVRLEKRDTCSRWGAPVSRAAHPRNWVKRGLAQRVLPFCESLA